MKSSVIWTLPFLILIIAAASAQPPRNAPSPLATDTEIVARLKSTLDSLAAANAFSGAVLLAKGQQVLVREAYGYLSRESKRRNRPETLFNLGSIDKAFTRIAIEQLARAHRLSLSDTLDRYVPEYPVEKARRMTLEHLLEHRAGTGDIFGPRYDAYDRSRLRSLRDWLPLFADRDLEFEPGAQQRYSNAGYVLLGLVIERVSGQSYFQYVHDHVFARAGMSVTASLTADERQGDVAVGYTREAGRLVDNRSREPWRGTSAGGGYSNIDDLLRFSQALRAGTFGAPPIGYLDIAGGGEGINAVLAIAGDYTLVVLANLDPPAAETVVSAVREWFPQPPDTGGRRGRIGGGRRGEGGPSQRPRQTDIPANGVDVAMLGSDRRPAIEVMVNGEGPFLFAIDTGAAGLARIDSGLARRLRLGAVGEVRESDPSGRNPTSRTVVAIDLLTIGGTRFRDVTAAVAELNHGPNPQKVDGVLAFGIFADTLLTLDFPSRRVRLASGELPAANGGDVLAYRASRWTPAIPIRVAGRELVADLDTGSMGGIALPETDAASLPLVGDLKVVAQGRTASNVFDIKAADLAGDVSIGNVTLTRPRLEFQPALPVVTVGARALADFAVTFDQRNACVRITRPTKGRR
jgi:D-alanyl-D-alanine carboxypeptidase